MREVKSICQLVAKSKKALARCNLSKVILAGEFPDQHAHGRGEKSMVMHPDKT